METKRRSGKFFRRFIFAKRHFAVCLRNNGSTWWDFSVVLWCFGMFDLETWGGERGKEIDETIKFRRKIGKMVAIKKDLLYICSRNRQSMTVRNRVN